MKEQNKKYLNIKKIKKQVKGITLIALVVTIIVLLILAGVALNLTIGQNGIFSRTQDAANTWRNAETNEQLALGEGSDLMDQYLNGNGGSQGGNTGTGGEYNTATTVADAISQNKFFKKDTTIKDDLQNDVRVPEGFKIAQDSAIKVENGIVIEDKDGNQFVWIPAKTESGVIVHTQAKGDVTVIYKRTDYGKQYGSYSQYSETLPADEADSVNANGGYYIGRFEAGDKESTDAKTMRTGSTENKTVTIKKGQVPYNYVTISNCKTLSEEMASTQRYKAKTKLASSYAWDTAISFIQITNEDYGNSSEEGNYFDTTFNYTEITGSEKTKNKDSTKLVLTGQTTDVCNIYDMGGNLWEYTTESGYTTGNRVTYRGGNGGSNYKNAPAGYRNNNEGSGRKDYCFRITLYV